MTCLSLEKIEVAEENQFYRSVDGVLFTADGSTLIVCSGGMSGSYSIPEGTTAVKYDAFSFCESLVAVSVPSSISASNIGTFAFSNLANNSVITVSTQEQYDLLNDNTFYINPERTKVVLAEEEPIIVDSGYCGDDLAYSLYDVGDGVYSLVIAGEGDMDNYEGYGPSEYAPWYDYASNISSVELPEGLTSVGDYAFYGCSALEEVSIPGSVTRIGGYAFSGCASLSKADLPDNLSSLGASAFQGCSSIVKVLIPSTLAASGSHIFQNCTSLEILEIAERVTVLAQNSFQNCTSLKSVIIPSSISSIGQYAFYGCSLLESVAISEGVVEIGYRAFYNCESVSELTIPATVESIAAQAFHGLANPSTITVASQEQYDLLTGSSASLYVNVDRTTVVLAGSDNESGETIVSEAFTYTVSNGEVTVVGYEGSDTETIAIVPSQVDEHPVTAIGEEAFANCTHLRHIFINEEVVTIGERAFSGCSSLEMIQQPAHLTSFSYSAFDGCISLTELQLVGEDGFVSVGNVLFSGDESVLVLFPRRSQSSLTAF